MINTQLNLSNMMMLNEYLKQYTRQYKPIHDDELASYKEPLEGDLAHDIVFGHRLKGINREVLMNNEHQYRSRKNTKKLLVEKVSALLDSGKKYTSFEDIYSDVSSMIVRGRPLTHLMAYDISLRIGARIDVFPHEFVYLHAGPLDGAKKLKEKYHPEFPIQTPRIETARIKEVVKEFEDFTAYDIEHFLCVFHNYL